MTSHASRIPQSQPIPASCPSPRSRGGYSSPAGCPKRRIVSAYRKRPQLASAQHDGSRTPRPSTRSAGRWRTRGCIRLIVSVRNDFRRRARPPTHPPLEPTDTTCPVRASVAQLPVVATDRGEAKCGAPAGRDDPRVWVDCLGRGPRRRAENPRARPARLLAHPGQRADAMSPTTFSPTCHRLSVVLGGGRGEQAGPLATDQPTPEALFQRSPPPALVCQPHPAGLERRRAAAPPRHAHSGAGHL
jgi:hypothetical protein